MILTLDFETYWDRQDYTLSKLTTEEYVRDSRFKVHCVGLQADDKPPVCVYGEEKIKAVFAKIPWDKVLLLCQNTAFDGFILKERYGIMPKMYLDTMSMFRFLYPDRRASLKSIAQTLGLPEKGNEVMNTSGKVELSQEEMNKLCEYCKMDVTIAWLAWQKMRPLVPLHELKLIDLTIRWSVDARLKLDTDLLEKINKEEIERKESLLKLITANKEELSSNDKFAELLRLAGVDPPIKISPTAVKKDKSILERADALRNDDGKLDIDLLEEAEIPWAYAFSKADKEFMQLLEHGDINIQALVEARLGAKSTITETRSKRFLDISRRGLLAVPLLYGGAATLRWSATGKINCQNLGRGSQLRDAIQAPDGYQLVVRDLSNIEARMVAYVAGEEKLVELFRANADVYCAMASDIYQRTITKEDKTERQVGKTLILGSGYGMGWRRFLEGCPVKFGKEDLKSFPDVSVEYFLENKRNFLFTKSRKPSNVLLEDFQAFCAICSFLINTYRETNANIAALWRDLDSSLLDIHQGRERQIGSVEGLITTCKEGFRFPKGRYIRYMDLKGHPVGRRFTWTRQTRDGRSSVYGGLCTENICQALARHVMSDQLLELEEIGFRSVFTAHDEIIFCVPENQAEECLRVSGEVMGRAPEWCKDLPLASEGAIAKTYGEAK